MPGRGTELWDSCHPWESITPPPIHPSFTFFNFSLLIWMFVGQITIISFSMLHPILALLDTNRSALNDSLLDSIFSHYSMGFIARELRRVSCAISAFFKIWKLSWLGNYWILLASFFLRQNAILFVFPYFRHTKKKKNESKEYHWLLHTFHFAIIFHLSRYRVTLSGLEEYSVKSGLTKILLL